MWFNSDVWHEKASRNEIEMEKEKEQYWVAVTVTVESKIVNKNRTMTFAGLYFRFLRRVLKPQKEK